MEHHNHYENYNGRSVIETMLVPASETLLSILEAAMVTHTNNRLQIINLFNYYLGNQPVFYRTKFIRPDIDHRIAENNAFLAVRVITGYTFGKPIQYVQRKSKKAKQISELNILMEDESKSTVDMAVAQYQSICGTAYKLVVLDPDPLDGHPLMIRALHPANTFVVYSSGAEKRPLMGVSYYDVEDIPTRTQKRIYDIYTRTKYFRVEGMANDYAASQIVDEKDHILGDVCIVEFPNGVFRLGDFEPVLTLFDAINELDSDRINAVGQFVQAYLKFTNCEMTEEDFNKAKRLGAFMVKNDGGEAPADIDFITAQLDQADADTVAQRFDDRATDILGIPQRMTRAGGGGDTGSAVSLRDGWADLETVATSKETSFKPPERRVLRIALNILHYKGVLADLEVGDIDIKFIRNRSDNLLVKAQSYNNLITAGMNDLDALSAVTLFTDPAEVADRNKADKAEKAKEAQAAMEQAASLAQPAPASAETANAKGAQSNGTPNKTN